MRRPHNTISIYVHISHTKKVRDLCRSMLKIGPMQQCHVKSAKRMNTINLLFSRIQMKNFEKLKFGLYNDSFNSFHITDITWLQQEMPTWHLPFDEQQQKHFSIVWLQCLLIIIFGYKFLPVAILLSHAIARKHWCGHKV